MAKHPSPERVRKLLSYDAETGLFAWLPRGNARWDGRYAGRAALTATSKQGYRNGRIDLASVKAHRVAWAIYYGVWPHEIDHINGDTADNRIANLREVTRSENCRNKSLRSDNASGILGVCARRGKWLARIHVDGREKCIGTFSTIAEAAAARAAASAEHGYHANHGRA